ncbi:MAG: hypothetical protein D6785_06975 [Planctomycetota bacterium]|nr:MAG: hypothetical protein D6785_06975 [Planctomycetota bacterium]
MKQFMKYCWVFVLFLGFGVLGCNSTKPAPKPKVSTSNWWEAPGNLQIRGYVAAFVGVANNQFNNLAAAQRSAELEAKRKIAAFLKTKIQSLSENWDKQAGDLLKKGSLSSFMNNETFTREFINTTLQGAMPLQYKNDGKNYYVLMGLRAQDFMDKLGQQIESNLDTMLLTDAMKNQARNRLQKLINEEKKKLNESAKFKVEEEGVTKKLVPVK